MRGLWVGVALSAALPAQAAQPWLEVPPGFDTVARLYEVPATPTLSEGEYIFDLTRALTARDCPPGIWRGRAVYPGHIGGELRYEGTFLACFPYGVGVARYPDGSAWTGMVNSYQRVGAPSLRTDSLRLAVPDGGGTRINPDGHMWTGYQRSNMLFGPDPTGYLQRPGGVQHLTQVMRLMALIDGGDGQQALNEFINLTWARSGAPLPDDTPVLAGVGWSGTRDAGPRPGGGGASPGAPGGTAGLTPGPGSLVLPSVPSLGTPPPRTQPTPYTSPTGAPPMSTTPAGQSSFGLGAPPAGSEAGRCLTGAWRRPNCGDGREAVVEFSGGDRGTGGFRDNDCARVCPEGRSFKFDYQIVAPGVMQVDYTSGQICGEPVTPRGGRQPFTCAPGALKFGNDYTR